MTMREIYADHAATTAPAPEVIEAMRPYLEPARFGNPSSVHRRGEQAREAIEDARAKVAALIGAAPEEIVFTASGSEANNLALKGVLLAEEGRRGGTPAEDSRRGGTLAEGGRRGGSQAAGAERAPVTARRRLVISAIEHPSVLETARHLESRGFPLTIVPVGPDGIVDLDRLSEAMRPDVALVSIMWVNNEVGTIQPIAEIARLAHACGARFHCDAVQAVGKLPVDAAEADVDFLSLAGHKLHGPLGAAALFVRRRSRIVPLVHGGHQERSRRAGTENLPAIVGLGAAAERARARLEAGEPRRLGALGERLRAGLVARVPGTRLNGDPARRLQTIVNLCFSGADGEAVLHELDRAGVTVSTGSACSAATPGPSHVLTAMGLRPEDAHASVRFSLGESNDEEAVEAMIAITPGAVERVRALGRESPRQPAAPPSAERMARTRA